VRRRRQNPHIQVTTFDELLSWMRSTVEFIQALRAKEALPDPAAGQS